MPSVSPKILVDTLISAFEDSGGAAILSSSTRNPKRFFVRLNSEIVEVWVYIWTLTPGGRSNLPDEYRIQMTSVQPPLKINPTGYTLLLGYEPDTGAFAGFDIDLHKSFAAGSSSVQVNLNCVRQALQDGISFDRKTNHEIVIGIRSDQLLNYMKGAADLHRHGKNAKMHDLLSRASSLEVVDATDMQALTVPRRRILSTVQLWARSANFRSQVLSAYENRCAVTRMQLKLIDAAHILPVHSKTSTDSVNNGIALSPTYHRAFDHGLIFLDERYVMRINEQRSQRLATLKLNGGIGSFRATLGKRIHLPHDKRQRPKVEMIRKANKLRHIIT